MDDSQHPKNVAEIVAQKFPELTQIQSLSFKQIYQGFNVVVCSETGSGKTEAALLPLFAKLTENPRLNANETKIVYISPLKALNRDIEERIFWLAEKLGISVGLRHGDTPPKTRDYLKRNPPNLLITTPESFQALISDHQNLSLLAKVDHVIIDEANELVQSKRGIQLVLSLARFRSYLDRDFQIICLSATIKSGKTVQNFFIGEKGRVIYLKSQKKYDVSIDMVNVYDNISALKDKIIKHIEGKTIVFVNTRHLSEALAKTLEDVKEVFDVHHSSLSPSKRLEVEKSLKQGKLTAVVATSSLELGIDIGQLDKIIQVGSPRTVETLAQRFGRSGHKIGLTSKGTIVALNPFDLLESIACTILLKQRWLEKPTIYIKPLDILANQIVAHLLIKKTISKYEMLMLIKSTYPYRDLSDNEFESLLDFLNRNRQIKVNSDTISLGPRAKSYFYSNLSTIISLQQYHVRDTASRQYIGVLDGPFVERYCDTGTQIVLGKIVWEILSIDYGSKTINVRRTSQSRPTIPSWGGDTLPVDPCVAQRIADLLQSKRGRIFKLVTLSEEAKQVLRLLPRVQSQHHSVTITQTSFPNTIVIISPLGTKANRALAILLEELLWEQGIHCKAYSSSMGVVVDGINIRPEVLRETLTGLSISDVNELVTKGSSKFGKFTDRFFAVARRFGINVDSMIEHYGAKRTHLMLLSALVAKEGLSEIYTDLLDIRSLNKVVAEKRIYVSNDTKLKQLAEIFLQGFLTYTKPDNSQDLSDIVKTRIQNKTYFAICLSCFKYETLIKVGDLQDGFKCPHCGAKYIGFIPPQSNHVKEAINNLKNNVKPRDRDVEKVQNELVESANLFLNYGRRGIIVLSGYGVGPKTAKNILKSRIIDERQLYMEILKAEQEYIRTREFWGEY
ncbi:MAG: DEAD/DEAH box helicase [Thermoprotei archaeon]